MEILSQCPDYLPVKNNPILNAFSHPGTTQSRRLFTGDTVKKCLLEERANEIHMQSLEDMRNSIRMPLVKLKKSYREHQNKLNDIIRRCQDIHKAGILVFRRYNLNQCMEFVMGGKVKKGLNQTESVCRASVTNMAFQCQELKNLFTISGLHMYGAMCCSLRDICATAALEITIHNSSSYPLPKILCSDVTKAHVTAKVNSRTTLKQLQRPKSSSPLGVKRSKMMRPFSAPNGNAATQLQSHNRTSSCNGGGNMQARNHKCVGDADDEENGYEDEFEDMSDTIKDVNVKQEEAINAHHVQPLNYQDVDDTIPEDDGSGDEYDLEMEQKPHRSSSPVRMKSAAYNRSRPVSAKRLSEMKLQALPPVMYNTELDAGIVVQWHPLPCPQCCKFFRGEGEFDYINS